jgi:hypothetical protein
MCRARSQNRDGWDVPAGRSAIAEVYPSLWRRGFAPEERTPDQHDAFCIAAWLARADHDRTLAGFLKPDLSPVERTAAQVEGWILGVQGSALHRSGVSGQRREASIAATRPILSTTSSATAKACPECGYVFRGGTWGGIDAHWKAVHSQNHALRGGVADNQGRGTPSGE